MLLQPERPDIASAFEDAAQKAEAAEEPHDPQLRIPIAVAVCGTEAMCDGVLQEVRERNARPGARVVFHVHRETFIF
jgi:hypothetical protein